MSNLTKREIILKIYEKTQFPQKQVCDTVLMMLDIIRNAIAQGQNVELRNFGVFDVQLRQARVGRNPHRPEIDVHIPMHAMVKFKPGRELKTLLKKLDLNTIRKQPLNP